MRAARPAAHAIGLSASRPYASNAISRPSAPLMPIDAVSRYCTCTQMNTRLYLAVERSANSQEYA